MTQYLEVQTKLQHRQKVAFLILVVGSLSAALFIPLGIIALYGLLSFWYCTWKIHRAKCPVCHKNVGLVQPHFNNQCRCCGEVLVESLSSGHKKNQGKWLS